MTQDSASNRNGILKGMSLCLSGFKDNHQKAEIHSLILELGATFTRDLLTRKTTHLIMAEIHGVATEKYEEAVKTESIEIVHYKWLEACRSLNKVVPTHDFQVILKSRVQASAQHHRDTGDEEAVSMKSNHSLNRSCNNSRDPALVDSEFSKQSKSSCSKAKCTLSFQKLLNDCLRLSSQVDENDCIPCPLFSSCIFFFVGFSEGPIALKKPATLDLNSNYCTNATSTSLSDPIHNCSTSSFLYDLQHLVRKYMGTICWQLHESYISHFIVHPDFCRFADLRSAITSYCKRSPKSAVAVTPDWILACIDHKGLLDPQPFSLENGVPQKKTSSPQKKKTASPKKTKRSSHMYQGAVFHIMNSSTSEGTVRFDSTEIQQTILSHGGTLLTEDILTIRQKEIKNRKDTDTTHRVCYIVNISGEFHYDHAISCNPMLSQINNLHLFRIIPVSPLWIQTCISEKAEIQADVLPILFQPQSWALRLIPDSIRTQQTKNGKNEGISVSVSGFHSHERSAIHHALLAIGAKYTDNLPSTNTHLICHASAAQGPKATKAVEWGIHVVTVDWLYHILQFGYFGEKNEENGCEHGFRLNDDPPRAISSECRVTETIHLSTNSPEDIQCEGEELNAEVNENRSRKSTVFADISGPMNENESVVNRVKRRRRISLETQPTKDICDDVVQNGSDQDVDYQAYVTVGVNDTWRKSHNVEGEESQNIWWGNSNFG